MIKKIIIAIDGYSSTGKSTLARMLSQHLGYRHINTGSMYRAVTLHALRNSWIEDDSELTINAQKIIQSIDVLDLDFKFDAMNICKMYMQNEDVEDKLKLPLVSQYVSMISTYPLVRKKIVKLQQKIGLSKGVVMEGRDIGSVVFPDAELKLFITANINVRASRRFNELREKGLKIDKKLVFKNLQKRDFLDKNRSISPLLKVEDAITIDNSTLTINDQISI